MKIVMDGLFYNGSGFAEDNLTILSIFEKLGHDVCVLARDRTASPAIPNSLVQHLSELEKKSKEADVYFQNIMGGALHAQPQYRYNIARTGFETDRIPMEWVPELNQFDQVWTFSEFNRKTFSENGVKTPLFVIPGYEPEPEHLHDPISKSSNLFSFLSVFDWQLRKGYPFLIKGFLEEFSEKENVELIIKTYSQNNKKNITEEFDEMVRKINKSDKPPIRLINGTLSREELNALYQKAHAFVLPTRGEGWGRPFFEAMMWGLPTIGTSWGGQMDFMTKDNSFLIDVVTLIGIRDHEIPLFNGHKWAFPSIDSLKKQMRLVFEHYKEADKKGKKAQQEILEKYTVNQLEQKIIQCLQKL